LGIERQAYRLGRTEKSLESREKWSKVRAAGKAVKFALGD